MKTRNRFVQVTGRMVAAVGVVAVATSAQGGPRSETGLAREVNKRLTIGRVVEVQPALQEAPVVPLSVMEAFPNADPDLFETMPVGVPIVTIEVPNNEAVAAGLVDGRGIAASGRAGEMLLFYQPNDSGFGWMMKNDDVAGYETWAMQAILGNGFEPGMAISGYDILVYNSLTSINDASWELSLWDGDPTASVDTTCNGGLPARIPGTTATFGPLPSALDACPPLFGDADPTCVGLYRLRVILPDKVAINCDRVWIGATLTEGCSATWRIGGSGGNAWNEPAWVGFSDAVWNLYACEQFGDCATANGYNVGVCGCDDGTPCDHTDGTFECTSGHPTFCGDGVADYINIRAGVGTWQGYSSFVASVYAPADVAIAWQPKKALFRDGSEAPSEVVGNEIKLFAGGVSLMLELQVSDWSGPDGTTRLKAFGAGLDRRGYFNGLGGALATELAPCTSDNDCLVAFGGFCSFNGDPCTDSSTCQFFPAEVCNGSYCLQPPMPLEGFCAPAYAVTTRPDFALRDTNPLGAADHEWETRYGWVGQDGATQEFSALDVSKKNGKAYMATLWVHVPDNAKGTYTIGLRPAPSTVLVDQDALFIPLVGQVSAKVTVATGQCCYNLDVGRQCAGDVTREECDALPGPRIFTFGEACSGNSDPCGCSVASPPKVAECCGDTGNGTNVRYLSFTAGNLGHSQAIRVTFKNLPAPFDAWNNLRMWVGPPAEYCENSGQGAMPPGGCRLAAGMPSRQFTASTLRCDPYYTDWSDLGTVHVFHEGIVPGSTYELEALDAICEPSVAEDYSPSLTLKTSRWGDVVKDCATPLCSPPDGSVDVPTDVVALVEKFRNSAYAPIQVRADFVDILGRPIPDQRTTVLEFIVVLDAFQGVDYPFTPGPAPCSK